MTERLARLVSINTENPPGREVEAADYLGAELRAIGCAVEYQEVLPSRANVIARLQNGSGPVFAFNTHMDVVPAAQGWTGDPFRLREADDRFYGRGACDAKGPAIAMVEAVELMANARSSWAGELLAVFVADEEAQSRGAKIFARQRLRIDYAVIGEPTSNVVATAHKGSFRPRIEVRGKTAHSGMPHLGINAVFKAGQLLAMIAELHERDIGRRNHALAGNASITVTRVGGGHADNVIPDRCEILVDRRLLPGETEEQATTEIETLLRFAREQMNIEAEIVGSVPTTGGASETPSDDPIVKTALEAAAKHAAPSRPFIRGPIGFPAACDLVHFNGLGAKGIVLGPGSLDVAHKPDEFVPVDEFMAAARIYVDTALALLRR